MQFFFSFFSDHGLKAIEFTELVFLFWLSFKRIIRTRERTVKYWNGRRAWPIGWGSCIRKIYHISKDNDDISTIFIRIQRYESNYKHHFFFTCLPFMFNSFFAIFISPKPVKLDLTSSQYLPAGKSSGNYNLETWHLPYSVTTFSTFSFGVACSLKRLTFN